MRASDLPYVYKLGQRRTTVQSRQCKSTQIPAVQRRLMADESDLSFEVRATLDGGGLEVAAVVIPEPTIR